MTAIRRGWFHLASGAGIGRIFGFAGNLLLSRWLGPTDLGLFNLVTTTVQTTDTLVRCGGDYALNFELGGRSESIKTEHGIHLARGLAQICTLMTVFICIGVAIWVWWGHGLFPSSIGLSQRILLSAFLLLMIACEGSSASAWEVLLVSHQTASLALKQGLFFPLRLITAAAFASYGGVVGAMGGWTLVSFSQCVWLKYSLGKLWMPLQICPIRFSSIRQLFIRGFPFYAANLLASMLFYPLLLNVAAGSGLSEIGYLRIGQVLQQLFAFLPATLVPVLFLKLRSKSNFSDQVSVMEPPLRIIWFFLLEILLIYFMIDRMLIVWLFGSGFVSALLPTRLLLITALFECLSQIVVQVPLAAGQTRSYGLWQNGAAFVGAVLGWLWIPTAGLGAYLVARLIYVLVPLIGFAIPVFRRFHEPQKLFPLILSTLISLSFVLIQTFFATELSFSSYVYVFVFFSLLVLCRNDVLVLRQALMRSA